MIDRIDRVLGAICQTISGVAFCFMALVAFLDSIGRMIDRPVLGANEYVSFALLLFFFATLPLIVRDNEQIRIGLLADLYKPKLARIEKLFTRIGELVALGLLTWMMFDQASRLARFETVSAYFKLPMAPWVYVAAFLSICAIWFGIRNFWRADQSRVPRPHAIPEEDEF
jgi:TRAP-type C4-dicarboxylate transport system permease small subunit